METGVHKGERRRFIGSVLAACTGVVSLGVVKKATAMDREPELENETLYRRTQHVEDYLRTLED